MQPQRDGLVQVCPRAAEVMPRIRTSIPRTLLWNDIPYKFYFLTRKSFAKPIMSIAAAVKSVDAIIV